jgi:hypothetical protein
MNYFHALSHISKDQRIRKSKPRVWSWHHSDKNTGGRSECLLYRLACVCGGGAGNWRKGISRNGTIERDRERERERGND